MIQTRFPKYAEVEAICGYMANGASFTVAVVASGIPRKLGDFWIRHGRMLQERLATCPGSELSPEEIVLVNMVSSIESQWGQAIGKLQGHWAKASAKDWRAAAAFIDKMAPDLVAPLEVDKDLTANDYDFSLLTAEELGTLESLLTKALRKTS